jgi:hypothetical protein
MTRAANGEAGGARHRDLRGPRAHTRVVGAGYVNTGIVLIDLLAYFTGRSATAAGQDTGGAVSGYRPALAGRHPDQAIDRRRSYVTQPSTTDLVITHGTFLDELTAGRLRHVGQPELDAAVRVRRAAPPRRSHGLAATWHAGGRLAAGGRQRGLHLSPEVAIRADLARGLSENRRRLRTACQRPDRR